MTENSIAQDSTDVHRWLTCGRCGRVGPEVYTVRARVGGRGYVYAQQCASGPCDAEPPVLRCDGCGTESPLVERVPVGSNGRRALTLYLCTDRAACLARGRGAPLVASS